MEICPIEKSVPALEGTVVDDGIIARRPGKQPEQDDLLKAQVDGVAPAAQDLLLQGNIQLAVGIDGLHRAAFLHIRVGGVHCLDDTAVVQRLRSFQKLLLVLFGYDFFPVHRITSFQGGRFVKMHRS